MTLKYIIPPFISKQMKILQSLNDVKKNDDIIYLDYVNKLNDKDKNDIEYLINKKIELHNQITEDEFNKNYEIYYTENEGQGPIAPTKEPEQPRPIIKDTVTEAREKMKKLREEELKKLENKTIVVDKYGEDTSPKKSNIDAPPIMQMSDFIKSLPTKDLIAEIRRRQLSENMKGTLIINNGKVNFSLNELNWPNGVYEIIISFDKDITEQYIEQQKKANTDVKKEEIK